MCPQYARLPSLLGIPVAGQAAGHHSGCLVPDLRGRTSWYLSPQIALYSCVHSDVQGHLSQLYDNLPWSKGMEEREDSVFISS